MKEITYEKNIFHNCLDVINKENVVLPVRFTPSQFDVYAKNNAYKTRSYCPTGINIDFKTNSGFINIKYRINDITRNWIFFDVFINDIFVESIGQVPIKDIDGEFRVNIPNKDGKLNRITIYLPHNVEIEINNIVLEEGSIVEYTDSYKRNLLCLGDSITQGMDAYHPSSTYPVLLSRFLEMNLINQGVGGYVFESESLDEQLPFSPDIITVAYGTNDWNKSESKEEFIKKCSDYIKMLVKCFPASQIYVITPFWRKDLNEVRKAGSFYEFIDIIKDICRGYETITTINGLELIPHMSEYMGDERLHPNDKGFLHIALNLAKVIKK